MYGTSHGKYAPEGHLINQPHGNLEKFGVSVGQGSGANPSRRLARGLRLGVLKKAKAAFNIALKGKKPSGAQMRAAVKVFKASSNALGAKARSGMNAVTAGRAPSGEQLNAITKYRGWVNKAIAQKTTTSANILQIEKAVKASSKPATVALAEAVAAVQEQKTVAQTGQTAASSGGSAESVGNQLQEGGGMAWNLKRFASGAMTIGPAGMAIEARLVAAPIVAFVLFKVLK